MIAAGTTIRTQIASPSDRAGVVRRHVVLALFVTLLLALVVTKTFSALQSVAGSRDSTIMATGKHHALFDQGSGQSGSDASEAGYPSGILESIDETVKVFNFGFLLLGFALAVGAVGSFRKLVLFNVDLEDRFTPPYFLRRPPLNK